jgi:hypothetical protein
MKELPLPKGQTKELPLQVLPPPCLLTSHTSSISQKATPVYRPPRPSKTRSRDSLIQNTNCCSTTTSWHTSHSTIYNKWPAMAFCRNDSQAAGCPSAPPATMGKHPKSPGASKATPRTDNGSQRRSPARSYLSTNSNQLSRDLSVKYYDFKQQGAYEVVQAPFQVKSSDAFNVVCSFDADSGERWGQASSNEMCISFLFYYPRQMYQA